MSYSIYGERLESGHCEVHPWVHADYPCPLCLEDSRKRVDEKHAEAQYWREMEEAYYAQMRAEEEYQSWSVRP